MLLTPWTPLAVGQSAGGTHLGGHPSAVKLSTSKNRPPPRGLPRTRRRGSSKRQRAAWNTPGRADRGPHVASLPVVTSLAHQHPPRWPWWVAFLSAGNWEGCGPWGSQPAPWPGAWDPQPGRAGKRMLVGDRAGALGPTLMPPVLYCSGRCRRSNKEPKNRHLQTPGQTGEPSQVTRMFGRLLLAGSRPLKSPASVLATPLSRQSPLFAAAGGGNLAVAPISGSIVTFLSQRRGRGGTLLLRTIWGKPPGPVGRAGPGLAIGCVFIYNFFYFQRSGPGKVERKMNALTFFLNILPKSSWQGNAALPRA